jgi:hypothetical protein
MTALKELERLVSKPSSNTKKLLIGAVIFYLILYFIVNKYLVFPADVERQLQTLKPTFQVKVRVWLALVKQKLGLDVLITSARRTFSQQMAQHNADSRNPKPDVNNPDVHMQGIAVDVNFKDKNGNVVVRKASAVAVWAPIVALAKACKIRRWGGEFKTYSSDRVHFDDL